MPFPFFKLGYMFIKQAGKPFVTLVKRKARTNGFFRNYVCIPPAQLYHRLETNIKMRTLGFGTPQTVSKLSDEKAVDLAADLLGEAVVFGIGAFVLYLEYRRSVNQQYQKDEQQFRSIDELQSELSELRIDSQTQEAKIRDLERRVALLQLGE